MERRPTTCINSGNLSTRIRVQALSSFVNNSRSGCARPWMQALMPERLRDQYKRLIGLLEGNSDIRRDSRMAAKDVKAMKQCQFALSPVPMPNVFIVGDTIAYEGMKRGGTGGFEMTHCEKNPA